MAYAHCTISSRLNSFRKYAEKEGINLLREDLLFIDKVLGNFEREQYKSILRGYLDEWLYGLEEIKISRATGQGLARRRANQWLLRIANDKQES